MLGAFPRACPRKIPPVEREDPLAGTSVSGGERLAMSMSEKMIINK
jgi:hypothetical protein